jgi:hypothetical protein
VPRLFFDQQQRGVHKGVVFDLGAGDVGQQAGQLAGQFLHGQYGRGRAGGDDGLGHAGMGGLGRVLDEDHAAGLGDADGPLHAVRARAGADDGHGPGPVGLGEVGQEGVDVVARQSRLAAARPQEAAGKAQVVAACRNMDRALLRRGVPVDRAHGHARVAGEHRVEVARFVGRQVGEGDEGGGQGGGEVFEKREDGFEPAGRSADADYGAGCAGGLGGLRRFPGPDVALAFRGVVVVHGLLPPSLAERAQTGPAWDMGILEPEGSIDRRMQATTPHGLCPPRAAGGRP